MDQSLNDLLDSYISSIYESSLYKNYYKSKKILDNCTKASTIIKTIKDLQKAKHQKIDQELLLEIDESLAQLHETYDQLFEVVQFNIYHQQLLEYVDNTAMKIETILKGDVL